MELTNEIEKRLCDVLEFICKKPLIFVSEVDVQSLVTRELMKIPELNPEKLYPTNCSIGLNKLGRPSDEKYGTMMVHREYGRADIPKARSDIVILNPKDIEDIIEPLDLKKGKDKSDWILPDYIFEFGTEKSANGKDVFREHLKGDIKKVNESKVKGYVIHIQRNLCKKYKSANKDKFEGYLEVVKAEKKRANPNVRILVFIVNMGNEGRIISKEGKIKLFKDGRFVGVNQKYLNEEIRKILN